MPDLTLPEGAWGRSPNRTTRRKRPDNNFDIAVDTDDQVDRFKRHKIDDGHGGIGSTLPHGITDAPGSAATETSPTTSSGEPKSSQISFSLPGLKSSQAASKPSRLQPFHSITSRGLRPATLTSEPRYSQQPSSTSEPSSVKVPTLPSTRPGATSELQGPSADIQPDTAIDAGKAVAKWEPKDWEGVEFDSDEETMSLAVTMRLANELSLLKSFLELYRKFNIHLGDIVSGPRHKGFLRFISSTVTNIDSHATHLRTLRDEKQRGNQAPGAMEFVAQKIARKFNARRQYLWDVMEEKVDMTDDSARVIWVKKKKGVLGDVMGGMVRYLEELGDEGVWKEREVREMREMWEKMWRAYSAMDRADLKNAGWVVGVAREQDAQRSRGRS